MQPRSSRTGSGGSSRWPRIRRMSSRTRPRISSSKIIWPPARSIVPPMQWTETEREPRQVAETFAEMVNAELRLMETNNQAYREQGGYYLTLYPGGGATESHPALASGERPLDEGTAPR